MIRVNTYERGEKPYGTRTSYKATCVETGPTDDRRSAILQVRTVVRAEGWRGGLAIWERDDEGNPIRLLAEGRGRIDGHGASFSARDAERVARRLKSRKQEVMAELTAQAGADPSLIKLVNQMAAAFRKV